MHVMYMYYVYIWQQFSKYMGEGPLRKYSIIGNNTISNGISIFIQLVMVQSNNIISWDHIPSSRQEYRIYPILPHHVFMQSQSYICSSTC